MAEVRVRLLSGRSVAFASGISVGEARRRLARELGHPRGQVRLVDFATSQPLGDDDALSAEAQLVLLSLDPEVERAKEEALEQAIDCTMEEIREHRGLYWWFHTIEALPESFGQLPALRELGLTDLRYLSTLPESFGNLSMLQKLTMSGLSSFTALPETFGDLPALRTLALRRMASLRALPESFGRLPALQALELMYVVDLASLPATFGQLPELKTLVLIAMESLAALPETFGRLRALTDLMLFHAPRLAALPESFGHLPELRILGLPERLEARLQDFGDLRARLEQLHLGS